MFIENYMKNSMLVNFLLYLCRVIHAQAVKMDTLDTTDNG